MITRSRNESVRNILKNLKRTYNTPLTVNLRISSQTLLNKVNLLFISAMDHQ